MNHSSIDAGPAKSTNGAHEGLTQEHRFVLRQMVLTSGNERHRRTKLAAFKDFRHLSWCCDWEREKRRLEIGRVIGQDHEEGRWFGGKGMGGRSAGRCFRNEFDRMPTGWQWRFKLLQYGQLLTFYTRNRTQSKLQARPVSQKNVGPDHPVVYCGLP